MSSELHSLEKPYSVTCLILNTSRPHNTSFEIQYSPHRLVLLMRLQGTNRTLLKSPVAYVSGMDICSLAHSLHQREQAGTTCVNVIEADNIQSMDVGPSVLLCLFCCTWKGTAVHIIFFIFIHFWKRPKTQKHDYVIKTWFLKVFFVYIYLYIEYG